MGAAEALLLAGGLHRLAAGGRAVRVQPLCMGAVAQLVANGTYAEIAAKYPDIVNNLTLLG